MKMSTNISLVFKHYLELAQSNVAQIASDSAADRGT
jgi:hypothetical protein